MATRSQAIVEAQRINERGKRLASNFGFAVVAGFIALGTGALFTFLVAPGARPDDVETFQTWGGVLLAIGAVGLISGWAMYSAAMSGARRVQALSKEHGFDPASL